LAAGAYWRCPTCLRRVPDKVRECYCGRVRQAGDGPDEADRPRPFPLVNVLLGLALVAIAALALVVTRRSQPSARSGTASPGPEAAARMPSSAPPTIGTLGGPALAFDTAMRDVRRQIRQLDTRLERFDRRCRGDASRSGCGSLSEQIEREAAAIGATLDAAESSGGSVDPAVRTELRRRNGVSARDVQAALARAAAATAGR
jgi:hypothetical protein